MRFATRLALLLPLACCATLPAAAQFEASDEPCAPGTAKAILRGADVQASLFTNGNLFYGNTLINGPRDGYVVPLGKAAPDGSPLTPLFMANFWLAGHVEGGLRALGGRYSSYGFRPGVTGSDGVPPLPGACAAADRIWVVSREDVARYLNGAAPEADLLDWPVHLGAPVLDGDGIADNYDLASGDQPAIRGDVTAFWAMTDTAADLSPLGSEPVGVDVTVEAFAFRQAQFAQHTFYRYTVTNRNHTPLDSAYAGMWEDFERSSGTYAATDTTLNLAFVYGTQDADPNYGVTPASGWVVAESPTDSKGEPLGLTSRTHIYNTASTSRDNDPVAPQGVMNRLQGRWNDGSLLREFGSGLSSEDARWRVTTFSYPGDPVTEQFWSPENSDMTGQNTSSTRRGTYGIGPFQLQPGASASFTLAYAFAQGTDRFASIRALRGQARGILAAQASGGFEPTRVDGPLLQRPLTISRPRPNPFRNATVIELQGATDTPVRVSVYDVLGRRLSAERVVSPEARIEIGRGLASGVYVVRVEGRGFSESFPIVKVR